MGCAPMCEGMAHCVWCGVGPQSSDSRSAAWGVASSPLLRAMALWTRQGCPYHRSRIDQRLAAVGGWQLAVGGWWRCLPTLNCDVESPCSLQCHGGGGGGGRGTLVANPPLRTSCPRTESEACHPWPGVGAAEAGGCPVGTPPPFDSTNGPLGNQRLQTTPPPRRADHCPSS